MSFQQLYDYSVTCIIMGGGAGTRLFPLTQSRAKPAVPVGAKFRLIDIPISNCLNSGLNRIYLLTQFNSTSLNRHVSRSYHFHRFSKGFVEILAAQQSPQYDLAHSWYEGNADAVRKNFPRLRDMHQDDVLILSGDQLYQMDFTEILRTHRGEDGGDPCDLTVAALPVTRERGRNLGIMRAAPDGAVQEFVEKPGADDSKFHGLEASPELLSRFSTQDQSTGPRYLANMGIYLFRYEFLEKLLAREVDDFGGEVLPDAVATGRVRAHLFDGYWEDIGTIGTFHQANVDLAKGSPSFDFYSQERPVYTRARLLPASSLQCVTVNRGLVSDGCRIEEATIEDSLIGVRSVIGSGCTIRNTFVMGNDYYESEAEAKEQLAAGRPKLGVGEGTTIENAIVDKAARVGRNVRLLNREKRSHFDGGCVVIRDGITVVPRGGVVPEGFCL